MEKLYTVTTSNGIYKINFINTDQFLDEIENLSGILAIDQAYYNAGKRVYFLETVLNFPKHEFQIICTKQGSVKYFIKAPRNTIKIYVTKYTVKTVKDLLSSFTTACRKSNCIYPSDQYAFKYNDQILKLSDPLSEIPPESDIKLVKKSVYPPLQFLKLKINMMTQKFLRVKIYSFETVSALKNLELLNCGVPINELKLIFNKRELEDEKTLDSYQLINESEINMLLKGKGGSADSLFNFFDLESGRYINFSDKAPKWRLVKSGFSWQGLCNNKLCEAYNYDVVSNFGFGIIKVQFQKNHVPCPLCRKKLSSLSGCGFYNCRYSFEGFDADNNYIKAKGEAGKQNYRAYWEKSQKQLKWLDLEIFEMDDEIETSDE